MVEAAGNTYISTEAQGSAQKQAADIEGLITQGCSALIVLAQDSASISPALDAAGLLPEEIGYINYHGTSTQLNDAIEARCTRVA